MTMIAQTTPPAELAARMATRRPYTYATQTAYRLYSGHSDSELAAA